MNLIRGISRSNIKTIYYILPTHCLMFINQSVALARYPTYPDRERSLIRNGFKYYETT